MTALLSCSLIAPLAASPAAASPAQDASPEKNIILLIADGMGYNHIDAVSLWESGSAMYQDSGLNPHLSQHGSNSAPSQVYQSFPVQKGHETGYIFSQAYDSIDAWASPLHATRGNPNERLNVTDSGAAATALSTGTRTRGGYLGWDRDQNELTGMVDLASEAGMATGLVTTSRFWADTPAAFAVHGDDGDDANTITQLLEHEDLDVVMGGGHPEFNNDGSPKGSWWSRYIPRPLWDQLVGAQERSTVADWTFMDDPEQIRALAAQDQTPDRVFALAQSDGAITHDRPGDRTVPYAAPIAENIVRLDEMAVSTLNVLSNASDTGFFAVIEEANVDGAGHAGELGRTVENMSEFNRTVESVVEWVETESSWDETTVIVTSDHETGNLWGTGTRESGEFQPLTGTAGELPAAEFTDFTDGEPGDRAPHYHTHQLVPFFARGGAAPALDAVVDGTDPVRGHYLKNTSIATVLHEHIRATEPIDPPAPVCAVPDFSDNTPGAPFYAPVRWLQCEGLSTGYTDGTYRTRRDISRGETVALLHRYVAPEETAATTSGFDDVPADHSFYGPIAWASAEDIATGYADGAFRPHRPVTRGEFASFLYRTGPPEHTAPTTSEFADLSVTSTHYEAITWLASEGITLGYQDGTFRPSQPVTRGEVAAFLHRYEHQVAQQG